MLVRACGRAYGRLTSSSWTGEKSSLVYVCGSARRANSSAPSQPCNCLALNMHMPLCARQAPKLRFGCDVSVVKGKGEALIVFCFLHFLFAITPAFATIGRKGLPMYFAGSRRGSCRAALCTDTGEDFLEARRFHYPLLTGNDNFPGDNCTCI